MIISVLQANRASAAVGVREVHATFPPSNLATQQSPVFLDSLREGTVSQTQKYSSTTGTVLRWVSRRSMR